jgi:hypothetical protein
MPQVRPVVAQCRVLTASQRPSYLASILDVFDLLAMIYTFLVSEARGTECVGA